MNSVENSHDMPVAKARLNPKCLDRQFLAPSVIVAFFKVSKRKNEEIWKKG